MTVASDWLVSLAPRMLDRVAMARGRADHSMLEQVSSVVHVGANTGQERRTYRKLGLDVIWVEAIPSVFEKLWRNINDGFDKQRAVCALVTDRDGDVYDFNISSNDGKSSSILELAEHRKLWPGVRYVRTVELESVTLPTLLAREGVKYFSTPAALVLDTQGSELMILKGAASMLEAFEFVTVEVADFESYADCCRVRDVAEFMQAHGFRERSRLQFADRPGVGRYYDITYQWDTR